MELTDLGFKILVEIGGRDYIDKYAARLIAEVENRNPKSGLDVQTYSNIVLTEKSSEDEFLDIKNNLFQNPTYTLGDSRQLPLDLGVATQIMGIYLRNKYFERYPDLKKDL
jgi:hypothetical protein